MSPRTGNQSRPNRPAIASTNPSANQAVVTKAQ
jgi:hypothetical protein